MEKKKVNELAAELNIDVKELVALLKEARDEVVGGMKSELVPTKPSQTYPTATVIMSI